MIISILIMLSTLQAPEPMPARCWSALPVIHEQESKCGRDLRWKKVGPAGEQGQFQICDRALIDIRKFCGFPVDPWNLAEAEYGCWCWLLHYVPYAEKRLNRIITTADMADMWRMGCQGFINSKKGDGNERT